ncbi:putative glycosyltransferase [Gordonia hirsuta DSM 44140 = NBRC 16056]|uniref:Putative glycosyltransferase n=1 Tax=Gordonia hirsuta DSM 44140 = NBRC 16056 TaxID=1121927 RepID=L7LEU3_9ACTN|nr:putative glycosyltransferase [Gordonia hirsuta DSM 44140 = NBRC 16056]
MRYRSGLIGAAAVVVAVVALWLQGRVVPYTVPFWGLFDNQLDLGVYRDGALLVRRGGDLYNTPLHYGLDYTYSPFSALIMQPLGWVPFGVASVVWSAGILVALYAVVMLSLRSLGRTPTATLRIVAVALVAVLMLIEPVRTTIWYGQINIFIMLVIIADLTRPDGARFKGVGTGIVAGIKLTPMIFAVYCAVRRNRTATAGVLAGFAATVVVGFAVLPRDSWQYWTDKLFESERVGSARLRGNQSLRGMLANHLQTTEPSTAWWLTLVAIALIAGFGAALYAHRRGQELLAITLIGMSSCAVSPMTWGHHWVWFVPLLVIGADLALRTDLPTPARLLSGAGTIAVFLVSFIWPTRIAKPYGEAYLVGLYVKDGIGGLQWFVVNHYLWVYAIAVVATVGGLWWADRRRAGGRGDPAEMAPAV